MPYKGYGRIYVDKHENIGAVIDIVEEIDQFEIDYLPKDLVAHISEYPEVVYTHKFDDMDLDILVALCWSRGIHIWVYDTSMDDYYSPPEIIKLPLE
jgi:hypothetical protein